MEGLICLVRHAVFIVAASFYLIRVFGARSQSGLSGFPRWLTGVYLICLAANMLVTGIQKKGKAEQATPRKPSD
jgi:uncharacterized membrane protein YhdT